MKFRSLSLPLILLSLILSGQVDAAEDSSLIQTSRDNCVRVIVPSMPSCGTGFFLDDNHILTCFHVIGRIEEDTKTSPPVWNLVLPDDAKVILRDGQEIDAAVIAPTPISKSIEVSGPLSAKPKDTLFPVVADFAILKLKSKPNAIIKPNALFRGEQFPSVGSKILFSGYPLRSPAMLTHMGTISGLTPNDEVICIQAPINKGNSGGGLLSDKGEVLGIIRAREGGISKGLQELQEHIDKNCKKYKVSILGVNQLVVTQELIKTFDTYISTGIGYARTIKHVTAYLDNHPELLK